MGIRDWRWLRFLRIQYREDEFAEISDEERRKYVLRRLEDAPRRDWAWILCVAAVGFLADAYAIFSINMVIPMLGIIYYGGTMPHSYEVALSAGTLGGTIIGQLGFGFAADKYGRRKMYGWELIITIGASVGVVMSSNGINGSMSIIVCLAVWRSFVGIGIGADYPLSAIICSEFAPSAMRGKMLTLVFFCQPLGQLAATLVALIALKRQQDSFSPDATTTNCTGVCLETLDSVWRWIIGLGLIPAFIAFWFRFTIIESPRYTADVGRNSRRALADLSFYQDRPTGSASGSLLGSAQISTTAIDDSPRDRSPANGNLQDSTNIEMREGNPRGEIPHLNLPPPATRRFVRDPASRSEDSVSADDQSDLNNTERQLGNIAEYQAPPPPSWEDFKDYFWYQGNLRTLVATSICWFCVDLPFYGLGLSNPQILSSIWYGKNVQPTQVYDILIHNCWQSLLTVSIGSVVGCFTTFLAIDKLGRRLIQGIGFFWLFILYIVIGGSFKYLYEAGQTSAVIVLYVLCQVFYNFGPNTTTFIMPAELFPTRYRGLCYGISAAFGKLGSVVAQLFLAYINYGSGENYTKIEYWLPYSVLIFSIFMLVGLFVTYFWLPRDESALDPETNTHKAKTLEQWEVGRNCTTFAQTRLARFLAAVYHGLVRMWEWICILLEAVHHGLATLQGRVYMLFDKRRKDKVTQQGQYQQEAGAQNVAAAPEQDVRRGQEEDAEIRQLQADEVAALAAEEARRRRFVDHGIGSYGGT